MVDEGAAETPVYEVPEQRSNAGKWILLLVAVLYVAGTLYAFFEYRGRLEKIEKSQAVSSAQMAALQKRVADTETSADAIASEVGLTKKQLAQKTAELRSQQREA